MPDMLWMHAWLSNGCCCSRQRCGRQTVVFEGESWWGAGEPEAWSRSSGGRAETCYEIDVEERSMERHSYVDGFGHERLS